MSPEEKAVLEAPGADWVRWYRPEAATSGFNLVLQNRRTPTIRDMNGRRVHSWPQVRAAGRVRLNAECELLVLGASGEIEEYTWSGEHIRTLRLPDSEHFPHHDVIRLSNGNRLLLGGRVDPSGDYLLEVDVHGRTIWEWRAIDHRDSFPRWRSKSKNPTHINSVREIPPNRWFDAGDERFRPGNILVSGRNLDTIFVVDRPSGDVVWQYSKDLDRQHEAIMLEDPHEHAGRIIVFNNGLLNRREYRRSSVQIIDPIGRDVVWQYGSELFFSSTGGTAQPFASGNVLITSSQGGRVFEVTPEKKVVWEWAPPDYLPMRVERLAYDHCPQLAALRPDLEVRVMPEQYEPYVSMDLYELSHKTKKRKIAGKVRSVLPWRNQCRRLVFPPRTRMTVQFGLAPELLPEPPGAVRFRMTLESEGGESLLVDELLETSSERLWHRAEVDLGEYAFETVRVCLSIERAEGPEGLERAAFWRAPTTGLGVRLPESEPSETLTEEELRHRRRQLEALGYVD